MNLRSALCLAFLCVLPAFAFGAVKRDIEQDLKVLERGEVLKRSIPDAKFRVAVFTYEDPDGTKLGDSLATLIGRELLVRSAVSSFGVLTYEGGLAPSSANSLSYFDKVEKLADAQDVTMSVWGMVRRRGTNLTIDTYIQLPPALVEKTFVWRIELPTRMKGELVAHLQPDRILAQRLELPDRAMKAISTAALRSNELRSEPADSSAVIGMFPMNKVYWIEKSQGDWIYLDSGAGDGGWARASGNCATDCAPVLQAAHFGAGLLAFMEKRSLGQFSDQLSPDAQAIKDQLEAFEFIDQGDLDALNFKVMSIGDQLRDAQKSGRVPPGGAALANAWMIDSLALQLQADARKRAEAAGSREIQSIYRDLEPDRAEISAMAFQLAEASLGDPGNTDVLHNLAVLFEYAGDAKRAGLARSLAERSAR